MVPYARCRLLGVVGRRLLLPGLACVACFREAEDRAHIAGGIALVGFLRRVRRPDPLAADSLTKGRVAFFADGHAETGDGIAWVEVAMSPSNAFVLLWRDANDDDTAFGHRLDGPGRYRLIEHGGGLRCEGRLERPSDGHAANSGTFILADGLFTDDLRARLHVSTAEGTELVRRECYANVAGTFIDADGRYAAVQMASNPSDERDDERFVVFDLARRSELWSKPLEVGRAAEVEFDVATGGLWITTSTFGSVRYGLADGSVELAPLRALALETGDGFEILALVDDEIASGIDGDRRETLVRACLRASDRLASYPSHSARALRVAGELLEASDPTRTAMYWEGALTLDPKVGIAKRLKELRRSVGGA
jgi:hypothetical protein